MTNEPNKTTVKSKPTTLDIKPASVYFLSLELANVLCFKSKERLDLSDGNGNPAQWTVILGNNGVGKTTLLRCLAGMENKEIEIHYQGRKEKIYQPLLLEPYKALSMWNEFKVLEENNSEIFAQVALGEKLKVIHCDDNNNLVKFQKYELKVIVNGFGATSGVAMKTFICYGYGATRRMGETSINDSYSLMNSVSLFSDYEELINAEEWLLQTDYAVKSSSGKKQKQFQKQLNQIIEVLRKILPEIEDIRIAQINEENLRPRAEFLTPYGWVGLFSLGLGYRTIIAWMVDLAVRLFKRYPDSEDPLAEPAIVLVDEIDLHLHPKWQRTIMEFLTERFPNTQFIVTAHSPLVVQAAQDANIVLLRREGDRVVIDNDPEIIENWRVDQVLTSVFEIPSARPASIDPLLNRREEILTKSKLTKSDRLELKELEAKIGTLPTAENPEDIKAMDIIRRAAKLLENSVTESVE